MKKPEDIKAQASEMVKKVLTVGVGAIFLTEESLRGLISELKIPKEFISGVLESAAKTKNDFLKNFSKEIVDQLTQKVDAKQLVEELLTKNEVQFDVKLKLTPKKDD